MKNALYLIIGFGLVLSGCDAFIKVDEVLDAATEKYCAATVERAVVKTVLDPVFIAKDKAVCIRCPGDPALSCVGDPRALPASQ